MTHNTYNTTVYRVVSGLRDVSGRMHSIGAGSHINYREGKILRRLRKPFMVEEATFNEVLNAGCLVPSDFTQ
jgi:hypothetical protein